MHSAFNIRLLFCAIHSAYVLMLTMIDQRKSHQNHSQILHNLNKYSCTQIKKINIHRGHTQKAFSEFKSTTQNGRIYNLVGMQKNP